MYHIGTLEQYTQWHDWVRTSQKMAFVTKKEFDAKISEDQRLGGRTNKAVEVAVSYSKPCQLSDNEYVWLCGDYPSRSLSQYTERQLYSMAKIEMLTPPGTGKPYQVEIKEPYVPPPLPEVPGLPGLTDD